MPTMIQKGVRSQESGVRRETSGFEGSRAPSRTFEDLIVWQKAHAWVLGVYRLSAKFPSHELYGLTSQLRRAAVSIPANIAEGYKKTGAADKRRFFNIAQGSLEECRYYLILTRDLNYGDTTELNHQLAEISRLLTAYTNAIQAPSP
ncbi:four helix bundle protein [Ereboglobus sp. PH5-10]|uniref:four helix bundle protein n=2 Tax=unclassified Ereboglobus TaxID=2626932 RepID=UPI0024071C83|nr:four helix bundle protein [Ereboglobus sp. PH5-10]MDF9825950.1 four helix bundle protein [Ereboglobus sp. PH5-10]